MQEKGLQDFFNLSSPKVISMYEAVGELIGQGMDLNDITVSDITKKAGIGKGTAYDYFSSKEEIIAKALLYHIQREIQALLDGIGEKDSLRDKIFALLNNIEVNYGSRRNWMQYLCFHMQAIVMRQELMEKFMKCNVYQSEVEKFIKEFQVQAVKEGISPPDLPLHCTANAVFSQVMAFWYYLDNGLGAEDLTSDEEKAFIYKNILKIIGE